MNLPNSLFRKDLSVLIYMKRNLVQQYLTDDMRAAADIVD